MPGCGCEAVSVGANSPGVVTDDETVLRLIISPRDLDDETGDPAAAPFEKVFKTGVSLLRLCASDEECIAQAEDILPHKPDQPFKQIYAVTSALTGEIRALKDDAGERIFGVYDQVVPRRVGGEQIATHAGLFARRPPKGDGKKQPDGAKPIWQLQKDYAGLIFDLFASGQIATENFRGHLFKAHNEKARDLGFQLAEPNAETAANS